uniref:Uncharacterized protein n=1 Tax=Cyprinus carpio carpio TaxID=630221 RepID=A0A9J7YA50_CYPCA
DFISLKPFCIQFTSVVMVIILLHLLLQLLLSFYLGWAPTSIESSHSTITDKYLKSLRLLCNPFQLHAYQQLLIVGLLRCLFFARHGSQQLMLLVNSTLTPFGCLYK